MAMPRKAKKVPPRVLTRQATVYLVIQEGGSSVEHYPSLYNTETQAKRAGKSHTKASYRSTAPIPVPMYFNRDGQGFIAEEDLMDLIQRVSEGEYGYQ